MLQKSSRILLILGSFTSEDVQILENGGLWERLTKNIHRPRHMLLSYLVSMLKTTTTSLILFMAVVMQELQLVTHLLGPSRFPTAIGRSGHRARCRHFVPAKAHGAPAQAFAHHGTGGTHAEQEVIAGGIGREDGVSHGDRGRSVRRGRHGRG